MSEDIRHKIVKHRIAGATIVGSYHQSAEELRSPKFLIIHSPVMLFVHAVELYSRAQERKRTMHALVDRRGQCHQFLDFNQVAWHAGASHHQGHYGLNTCSLGLSVLLENSHTGPNEAQLETLDELIPNLVWAYNLRDIANIGEVDAYGYRYRGGEQIDLARWLKYVEYGNQETLGRYTVTTPSPHKLHVRGGPGTDFEVIDDLDAGEEVRMLRSEHQSWALVVYRRKQDDSSRRGWVHESFIRRS